MKCLKLCDQKLQKYHFVFLFKDLTDKSLCREKNYNLANIFEQILCQVKTLRILLRFAENPVAKNFFLLV